MTVENLIRIVWRVFEQIEESRKMTFLAIFGRVSHTILMPLHTQGPLHTFGCRMIVQNVIKIVWTVFEENEIFIERWEKKTNETIA